MSPKLTDRNTVLPNEGRRALVADLQVLVEIAGGDYSANNQQLERQPLPLRVLVKRGGPIVLLKIQPEKQC
jgi:hypothetical protein